MTKNLKEIVLQQIYDSLNKGELDNLKVLITLLQTLNGDEIVNEPETESILKDQDGT